MSLQIGQQLGSYEIMSLLGKGGMGEVYRARDTKLDRDVAIKTLPEEFEADAERLSRFEREAKLLASLNHPNIAAIYGLERYEGKHVLILELVEGETLADHLTRGRIPVDESLRLAAQIAEALQAAHEKGVIHRDLKPANIKITEDGTVKVLDFGLAKAADVDSSQADVLSNSPTLRTLASSPGMILGTAAYMSPEQAKGRPVDRRSDIWAFGCVLYEMLTGRRAFAGEDISDTLAAVLRSDPDWNALPKELPPAILTLLKNCLDKDRRQRIADISTALFVINKLPEGAAPSAALIARTTAGWRAVAVGLSLLTLTITGIALWKPKPSTPGALTRFSITAPEGQGLTNIGTRPVLAISPDGPTIVYVANQQLYLRSMSDTEARPIPGTQFSEAPQTPVFSPDGTSVAFYTRGAIRKTALTPGASSELCEAGGPLFGMSWSGDTILLGLGNQGIKRCSANGGPAEQLISVKDDETAHGPQLLPGGRTVLYTLAAGSGEDRWERAKIVAETLASKKRTVLIDGGTDARYVPTGHLIYAREGVLYAAAFDPVRLEVGSSVPVLEGIRRAGITGTNPGTAQFAVSNTGTLIYIPGPVSTISRPRKLALIARNGDVETLNVPPRSYEFPRFSPDGKRVAVEIDERDEYAIWTLDPNGTSPPRRLTLTARNRFPVWNTDGDRVAFQSDREGDLGIWWQRADGTGIPERLTKAEQGEAHIPSSWSPVDRDTFLFTVRTGDNYSLSIYSLKQRKAVPVPGVVASTTLDGNFSRDGRWIEYSIRRLGKGRSKAEDTIFMRPFPITGETHEIISGGTFAAWSKDGNELFIFNGFAATFSVVRIMTRPTLTIGNPVPLPRRAPGAAPGGAYVPRNWDISPVDNRVLGIVGAEEPPQPQIRVVLSWVTELQQRVPVK